MEEKLQHFENLKVWLESMSLCQSIYSVLKPCRDFALKDQMQRSVVSISSNIAEGFELYSNKQLVRYFRMAKGSCGELRTQLYIAVQQGYIDQENGDQLIDHCKKVSAMLQKFIDARIKWDHASSNSKT